MKIQHIPKLNGSDALVALHLAIPELIQSGAFEGRWGIIGASQEAFIARTDQGEVAGVLTFKEEDGEYAWIGMGWVHPDHRRQGVYRSLYQALCDECRKRKLDHLEGTVLHTNPAMMRCAERLGRVANRTTYQTRFRYAE